MTAHPSVLEAFVIAVPDSQWGEKPKAYVIVRQSNSSTYSGETLTAEGLIHWAREQSAISSFMLPREVEVVEELPKTATGKVQKNVLRAWARDSGRML